MKRRRRRHRARNQLAPEHPQGRSHDHAARSSQSVLTAVGGGGEAIPRSDSAIHSSFSSTLEGDYEMLPSTSGMQGTSGNNTVQGTSKSRIKQRAGRKRTGSSQSVVTAVAGGGEAIPLSTFSSTLEGDYEILPSADGTSGMQGTSDNNTVQGTSDSRRRQRAGRKRTGKDRQHIYDGLRYDMEDAGTYTGLKISSEYENVQSPNAQPVSNPEVGENAYDTLGERKEDTEAYAKLQRQAEDKRLCDPETDDLSVTTGGTPGPSTEYEQVHVCVDDSKPDLVKRDTQANTKT
ncbi:hypothetical protein BaRGS_00039150 [Batillaria attramentaria]|uniref:Uncharacterized protein n=1 Tax=Batillaria attramentaria TaxID=370345 RepID=A0ABD0J488_9CAEN